MADKRNAVLDILMAKHRATINMDRDAEARFIAGAVYGFRLGQSESRQAEFVESWQSAYKPNIGLDVPMLGGRVA